MCALHPLFFCHSQHARAERCHTREEEEADGGGAGSHERAGQDPGVDRFSRGPVEVPGQAWCSPRGAVLSQAQAPGQRRAAAAAAAQIPVPTTVQELVALDAQTLFNLMQQQQWSRNPSKLGFEKCLAKAKMRLGML